MTRTTTFAPLFEPLPIGAATFADWIMYAPMSVCYGDEAGFFTRPHVEHYARRARGGAGTIIAENFAVSETGRQKRRQTVVSSDAHRPGLAELAGAIKAHGALAMVQLAHAGRYVGPWDVYHEARRRAPAAVPFELTAGRVVTPQEITPAEIATAIDEFGRAAELCERAGFDGLDVHGARGFLISVPLPADEPAHRRVGRQLRQSGAFRPGGRPRGATPHVTHFTIGFHLMTDELVDGGWSLKDALQLTPPLVAEGVHFFFAIPATLETLRLPANLGLYGRPMYGVGDAAAVLNVGEGDRHVFGFTTSSHPGSTTPATRCPLSTPSAREPAGCTPQAIPAAGDRAATLSVPTSSTTPPTRGAAGSNGSPTSTRYASAGPRRTGRYHHTSGPAATAGIPRQHRTGDMNTATTESYAFTARHAGSISSNSPHARPPPHAPALRRLDPAKNHRQDQQDNDSAPGNPYLNFSDETTRGRTGQ